MIEQLFVREGDAVTKGQPLATIIVQQNNSQGIALSTQLVEQLSMQIQLLNDEIAQNLTLQKQESLNLQAQKHALTNEQVALQSQLALADEKLGLLNRQQSNLNRLNKNGFLSNIEREQQQQALLDAKQEKQNLARLLMQQENQLSQLSFNIANVPQQYMLRINSLKRQQADIKTSSHKLKVTINIP
ncbi:hypothetical protein P4S63_09390 [Pseudoalteromonas sp. B193]